MNSSVLREKLSDENMKLWYDKYLVPGERIIASAYGFYAKVGTFISNGGFPGYFAVTSMNRILFHNNINSVYTDGYIEIQDVKKIKLKRGILGNLVIKIEYKYEITLFKHTIKKAGKLKFSTPKDLQDNKFKNHKENVDMLETILDSMSTFLSRKNIALNSNYSDDNEMRELYNEIQHLSDILENKCIDYAKMSAPISADEIKKWELNNGVVLPKEYKDILKLSNGLRYSVTSVYSLNHIYKDEQQFNGYYIIGEFIGDGSLLLCDEYGTVYAGDHVNEIYKIDFKDFISNMMIKSMKEDLESN